MFKLDPRYCTADSKKNTLYKIIIKKLYNIQGVTFYIIKLIKSKYCPNVN